jgi:ribosomal protein L40E
LASTYIHLSGRSIDNALLKLNGIKTEDEVNDEEHKLRIRVCLRCQEPNSPTNSFCSRCGSPLDVKTEMQVHEEEVKIDGLMDNLLESPEVKEPLLSKLRALGMRRRFEVL